MVVVQGSYRDPDPLHQLSHFDACRLHMILSLKTFHLMRESIVEA